jgi:tripartite-type tricarboxylate transporter receptor subunit TctC
MTMFRCCAIKAFAVACASLFAAGAWAQAYPAKVVRYIIPGSPGSGDDVVGRFVAGGLSQVFRQQVIVDNRAGAGGNIGPEVASRAPADGYTLLHLNTSQAINATLYRNLSYNLARDFVPVSQLAATPAIVVVHPSLPVRTISDLVKLAKARPGAINYASAGTGTPTFLGAELFKARACIDMVHVPYKGGGEAQTSMISGETSVYIATIGTVLAYVTQGRLRGIAVTTPKRVPMFPDYPTVDESGVPGYVWGTWYGLMAPAKTPRDIVATVHAAVVSALNNPAVSKRLTDLIFIPTSSPQPEDFGRFLNSEIASLGKIIRDLNLSAD